MTHDRSSETSADRLIIGLVNNMPDAALESTERQFRELLDAASAESPVHLRLFSLPDVPRGETARRYMNEAYGKIDELWDTRLDALIVTGAEPQAACLKDEPYWVSLTRVLEWAQENTVSTVWSCLAAHAAVLHMDGIVRRPLMEKRCGVFDCIGLSPHPLLAGARVPIRIAHSRCNDLREEALTACNYKTLTRSPEAGVDTFVKEGKSLFVFFQGHPEYDRRALLREYRRDVGRFMRGERQTYPAMPRGYFDPTAADALARFQERAVREPHQSLLEHFPFSFLEGRVAPSSGASAVRIYANWLSYVGAPRQQIASVKSSRRALHLIQPGATQSA